MGDLAYVLVFAYLRNIREDSQAGYNLLYGVCRWGWTYGVILITAAQFRIFSMAPVPVASPVDKSNGVGLVHLDAAFNH